MRVLRVPGFAPLLAGQAVNAIGNWVALIAIWGFAAFRFDAGAGDLALLLVVLSLPGALLGPLLGVPIDRLGPRRTLILANGLGFLSALSLTQAGSYTTVIMLALPLGLIEALATASLDALAPRLVDDEDLVSANALLEGAQDLAIVIGPVVAAVVNAAWGLAGAFLTDAATFLVGLAVALPLQVGPAEGAEGAERAERAEEGKAGGAKAAEPAVAGGARSTWASLSEGLRLARRVRGLRWTLAVASITYLLWALFGVLEPLYVREVLGQSDSVFALLQTVFGIGLVGGGFTLAALGDRMARPRYVAIATIVSGVTAALYLGTESLAVAFLGVFLWGADVAFFYAPAKTLLQRYAPPAAHGRILSLNQSLEPLSEMVMAPVAAVVVGAVGIQVLGVAGGVLAAAVGVVAMRLARSLGPVPSGATVAPPSGTVSDVAPPGYPGGRQIGPSGSAGS